MLKTGDLVLVRAMSITGWFLRFITGSEFNHVAIVLNDEEWIEANSSFRNGVRLTPKYLDSKKCKCRVLRFSFMDSSYASILEPWLRTQVGASYDWLSAFRFIFRLPARIFRISVFRNSPSAYYCLELAVRAFEVAGCPLPVDLDNPVRFRLDNLLALGTFTEVQVDPETKLV